MDDTGSCSAPSLRRLLVGNGLVALVLLFPLAIATATTGASAVAQIRAPLATIRASGAYPDEDVYTSTAYLPLITSSGFTGDEAIWVHASEPAPQEVALFRRSFSLEAPLTEAELRIFADTRYEAWLDGSWIGRGPARFSETIREYDVYELGHLESGSHLVAVLVQWAPNARRSESTTPFLQAHVEGSVNGSRRHVARSGSGWRALDSNAWREDAVPVHSWDLIGPTELLDLRLLPKDWMETSFSEEGWEPATVKDVANVAGRPRSISVLEQVPITPTVMDVGSLSPGHVLGEVAPSTPAPYDLAFEVPHSTLFSVEMLPQIDVSWLSDTVRLDGESLTWTRAAVGRPDVQVASHRLAPGAHTLTFRDVPWTGLTFSVSSEGTDLGRGLVPFQQGAHAGRRLLLAKPVSVADVADVHSDGTMSLEIVHPPAYVVLDLGRTVHGRLTGDVMGPRGTVLDIGWDERLWQGTRPLPYPGSLHEQWNQVDSWVLDGTQRAISTLDARAGRYVLVAVWGEGPVHLDDVQVLEERYPTVERGAFGSPNEALDRVWQVGVDSLYPNLTDAYTDTPWRERGQWWGDAYVADHVNRAAFGDRDLLRRGLLFMADGFEDGVPAPFAPSGSGTLLDYGMLWVQTLEDYVRLTEDTVLPLEVYPELRQLLEYLETYEHADSGLLDIPVNSRRVLIDWAAGLSCYGQSTAVNSLYYGTLLDAARVAESVGRHSDAVHWREKADSIRLAVNRHLYDADEQLYRTTIIDGREAQEHESLHSRAARGGLADTEVSQVDAVSVYAQAWPLAYGVVPADDEAQVADALTRLLSADPAEPNVEIYGMFWILRGLGEAGRIQQALAVIDSYYGRLLDMGATTWWEGFNAHMDYSASLSHAWGGGPTWFLTNYVLGARPTGPETWLVKPAFRGLGAASGSLPLAGQDLAVEWNVEDFGEATLRVSAPPKTTGEIIVPFIGSTTVLTLNQQVVWRDGTPLADGVIELTDGIHLSIEGGEHFLEAHQDFHSAFLPMVFR